MARTTSLLAAWIALLAFIFTPPAPTTAAEENAPKRIAGGEAADDELITDVLIDGRFVFVVKEKGIQEYEADDLIRHTIDRGHIIVTKHELQTGRVVSSNKPVPFDRKESRQWPRILPVNKEEGLLVLTGKDPRILRAKDLSDIAFVEKKIFAEIPDACWAGSAAGLYAMGNGVIHVATITEKEQKLVKHECPGVDSKIGRMQTGIRQHAELQVINPKCVAYRTKEREGICFWNLEAQEAVWTFSPELFFTFWSVNARGDLVGGQQYIRRGLRERRPESAQKLVWLDHRDLRYRYGELPERMDGGHPRGAVLFHESKDQVIAFADRTIIIMNMRSGKIEREWKAGGGAGMMSADDHHLLMRGADAWEVWDLGDLKNEPPTK